MQSTIGMFELVLLMTLQSEGDAYGVPIRRAVEAATGRSASSGAIFTTLERLEARGLVTSRLGDASPTRGGRPRRYYRLSAEGRRTVASQYATLHALARRIHLKPSGV